uniref:Uncharacterized protein n=1 Tax=Solanum tuberosum TaxID=4113 RepID=M1D8X8_SOLTU
MAKYQEETSDIFNLCVRKLLAAFAVARRLCLLVCRLLAAFAVARRPCLLIREALDMFTEASMVAFRVCGAVHDSEIFILYRVNTYRLDPIGSFGGLSAVQGSSYALSSFG